MASDEYQQKQLGTRLNRDKVKLWEPPYTEKDGQPGDIPQELVSRYAGELGLPEEKVRQLLENLRLHAVQKLAERERFQKSGLATVKLKVAGNHSRPPGSKQVVPVEVGLEIRGSDFKQIIAEKMGIAANHLKAICSGRVLSDSTTLKDQNIKNGSQVLVLCLSTSESEELQDEEKTRTVRDTRQAAELLSSRADEEFQGDMDVQIADQSGKPLQLPAGEKKALVLAMTLHEKGRSALKNKDALLALPLLLEADKEFRSCRAAILDSVDNYAVLCLDIVWCYLCLKDVEDLPDAAERLATSESFFRKSYGTDMERLMAVKGESGKELALFMKLHLLQGIVAFHQQRLQEAEELLAKAESELRRLQVDEEKLTEIMTMGFQEREGRLGLRASGGDLQGAIAHIMKRKEEKEENAKKVKEERRKKKLAKNLGRTANGNLVNIDNYEMLISMGYGKGASAEAMRQANNDVSLALEVLQNHPEYLSLPDPGPVQPPVPVTDDMIAQLTSLGFEPEMAHRALVKHRGDAEEAANDLVQNAGFLPPGESPGSSSGLPSPSTPSTSSGSSSVTSTSPVKTPEERQQEKETLERLVSDIPEDEEDYLDLTLTEERQFLQEYSSLLQSLKLPQS